MIICSVTQSFQTCHLRGPACHVCLLSMSQLGRKVKMEMAEKGNTAMDKEGDEGNQAQPVS